MYTKAYMSYIARKVLNFVNYFGKNPIFVQLLTKILYLNFIKCIETVMKSIGVK